MKILLVHQNFPGQFLHLAPALKARGHEVLALTAETNGRAPDTTIARYRWSEAEEDKITGPGAGFARAAFRGGRAARAAAQLRDRHGFVPDVIFGHSGWGETLFLNEVWPQARMLAYAELMYRTTGLDTDFDAEFQTPDLDSRITTSGRRAHMLQAMIDADAAVAPTAFQAGTFPAELLAKIRVIHDGVDTARVRPDPQARLTLPNGRVLAPGDEVLSFVNRRLDPYRGFHVLMRALPEVMAARPEAQVVLVGDDGRGYGGLPRDAASWREKMLAEVGDRLDLSRVHFLGRVPYPTYLSLLQVSRVHAYLTYPFVLGWSMVEAMAAGCALVASRTAPVQEAVTDGVEARLVDFFDIPGWSQALTAALADPASMQPLRLAARARALRDYDLRSRCLPAMIDFVEGRVRSQTL
ncbi:glycosyltransferase [Frigidibacter sp. MR17.24]|uniref:glycosyltransferase n=1 Tax=Frigidibacter sp. MR17.24 TaxID=3127345 RepID=UPI003012EA4B